MANLEKIMAETSKSYDASRKALNNQINAISGDLVAQQDRINAQYAQQGKSLANQRNWQAQSSSMAASRNGGSFGGSSEIANKKYYQQAYVPAVTQMQTNQANDISAAESDANQRRLSLQQTLAQLNDEASKYAMQRYDAAREAEREDKYRQQQLALQKKQLAAQQAANNWMQYLNTPSTSNEPKLKNWSFGRGYSVQQMPDGTAAYYKNNGKTRISAGEFLSNTGTNWNKWNDIWQNGISTTGVGSDTISAFHRMSINPNSNEYSYLFRS
jgi:hypothetical protein